MIRFADRVRCLTGWRRGLLAWLAGAVSGLALPPLDLWPLLFAAVPIFLLLLEGVPRRAYWLAFFVSWLFGLGYFVVALHWIGFAFLVDAATYLWMMPFAVGGLAAMMAVYWGLAGLAARLTGLRGLPLALGFTAFLATAEYLRGHLFTGFPWAAPGLSVVGMGALAQTSALIGMTGLTAMIIAWAGLPLVLADRRHVVPALLLLALAPLGWIYGSYRLSGTDDAPVAGVRLRLVQPDIGQSEKWREDNARAIFDKLLALSRQPPAAGSQPPTHIIWPESAVPFLIDESPVARDELARLLGGAAVLITGAIRRQQDFAGAPADTPYYNSMITFDGGASVVARYDKWRLVPGGEFLPLAWLLEPLGFRKVVTVPGNFTAGAGPVTIPVPLAPAAAMLICYEAIFPDSLIDGTHRPAWLINVTNDGWFGKSTGPWQHLSQARLRAIEQGLPLARAANTGVSAVIDPYGRILQMLPLGAAGVIDADLPAALPVTIYGRFGDTMLALLIVVMLGMAGLIQWSRVKDAVRSIDFALGG